MPAPIFKKSFNSGEWAPQLYSRVDLEKYKSGTALSTNFFVDYRGGITSRAGTQYVLACADWGNPVRLIPFQASTTVSYIMEFGQYYIRFFQNGAPILENAIAITGISQGDPGIVSALNSFSQGDMVYISGVSGMTGLNGNYYFVESPTPGTFALYDLYSNPVNTAAMGPWTGGGTVARVYKITTTYLASELQTLKFAQEVNSMVLTHPNHPAALLTINSYNNWTLAQISFGSPVITTGFNSQTVSPSLLNGQTNYSYVVTAIDAYGNESIPSLPAFAMNLKDLRTTYGSIQLGWTVSANAVSYNLYKSTVSYTGVQVPGVPYGYIGQFTGNAAVDSNIAPDFDITPPVYNNPFEGLSVIQAQVTSGGFYNAVPTVSFVGGGVIVPATAQATLGIYTGVTPGIATAGSGYAVGDTINFGNGVILQVTSIGAGGSVNFWTVANPGQIITGSTPSNPVAQVNTSGTGTGASATINWSVTAIYITGGGIYTSAPTVSVSVGSPTATATLTTTTGANINPSVCGFFQQRLVLGAGNQAQSQLDFSRPGSYYNYDYSSPIQANDSISVTLASGQLEVIKSVVPTAPGLIIFTDKASWMLTGGSLGSAISPSQIVANRQSYVGANDVPPIVSNFDILFVTQKGSAVYDSTYNYYAQIFTGQDISVVSSHLFYGYEITEWAWAQFPYKVVWAVRNDGTLLSLTFAKEEDFIAWSHHTTQGQFISVATVPEVASDGSLVDAVYAVVRRQIGSFTVQYIERFTKRILNGTVVNAWCVDAGLQYSGSPQSTFSGAQHLAGATVTGLADGVVIPPFTMPASGTFTLSTPASVVTVGLGYTCQMQTLPLDTGDPTIRSRMKKLSEATLEVVDTLGLSAGTSFDTLVPLKDLIIGNVGSMTNEVVTDLVTGEARLYLDTLWQTSGQFCVQQSQPLPATITGLVPRLAVGGATNEG